MKKLFILSFLLIFQFGFSQKISEKSLLWEISGKNLEKPSYLYGTIHIVCKGEELMTNELQKAFDKTETLALEVDMSDPSLQTRMLQISFAKDGKKMSDRLSPEVVEKLDSLFQSKLGAGFAVFEMLSPQFILAQLSLLGLDCPMDLGYDMVFMNLAKTEGKDLVGLESIDTQIDALFSQSNEDAVAAISYLAENQNELKSETLKMMNLYKQKDVQGLYEMTKESFQDPKYPQSDIKVFLDNRNISWIPVIEKLIAEKPAFIAVGAAHLAGENGVINLLKKQGYTLKPIQ